MAKDATPCGRLVRLYDVVTWLKRERGLPDKHACNLVEDKLGGLGNADLFCLQPDDFATPFNGSEDFTPGISERSFWDAQPSAGELGVASVRLWLSAGSCGHVGVLMTLAHELWGYGEPERASNTSQAVKVKAIHDIETSRSDPLASKADPFGELSDLLRNEALRLIAERGRKMGQLKKIKGARWTDAQRVIAADVVAALDDLRPGSGIRALAEALGVERQSLEGVLAADAVSKARKALRIDHIKTIAPKASVFTIGGVAQDKG